MKRKFDKHMWCWWVFCYPVFVFYIVFCELFVIKSFLPWHCQFWLKSSTIHLVACASNVRVIECNKYVDRGMGLKFKKKTIRLTATLLIAKRRQWWGVRDVGRRDEIVVKLIWTGSNTTWYNIELKVLHTFPRYYDLRNLFVS